SRRHQVAVVTHVDTEVASVRDGRTRDPDVHLSGTGFAEKLHQRTGGRAADERVVDHDDASAGQVLGERIELQRHASFAQVLGRFDEGATDVAVLDQAVVVRDATGPAEPDGGRDRR